MACFSLTKNMTHFASYTTITTNTTFTTFFYWGCMSTTSIRIKDDVYSRLEMNAKGYESVSDTISRAIKSLEEREAFDMIDNQVAESIQRLSEEGSDKERVLLMHYQKEAIQLAMDLVVRLYPEYRIEYEIKVNACSVKVTKREI